MKDGLIILPMPLSPDIIQAGGVQYLALGNNNGSEVFYALKPGCSRYSREKSNLLQLGIQPDLQLIRIGSKIPCKTGGSTAEKATEPL